MSIKRTALILFLPILGWLCATVSAQAVDRRMPKCPNANGLTRGEIIEILNVHNLVRAGLKLPQLTWDCKLADLAQEWATRGITEHRDDTIYGESIFVSAARDAAAVASVNRWMQEKANWDNKSGKCAPGITCTHYTQVVWKKTTKIGCGINRNLNGKWKTMLVCNYDPAGNDPGPAY